MDTKHHSEAEDPRPKWWRRKFIINPKFQLQLIGYVVVLALIIIGVLYGANFYFFQRFEITGREMGLSPNHIYFKFLHEQNQLMTGIFAITSSVVFMIIFIWGTLISHRIAGPLYRLCKHLIDISEGKTTQDIRFRKKDFFPEVAEALNRLLQSHRDQKTAKEKKDSA
jgi:methyl-accepting chemotaxis protein